MRTMMAVALVFLLTATPVISHAQATARKLPGCNGIAAVVRVSTLTGSMTQFDAAVTAHRKWYRDRGITFNEQRVVPMYKMVESAVTVDSTQVMTIHTNPPATNPPRDAAWEAFTKMYSDVSKVASQAVVCLPKTF